MPNITVDPQTEVAIPEQPTSDIQAPHNFSKAVILGIILFVILSVTAYGAYWYGQSSVIKETSSPSIPVTQKLQPFVNTQIKETSPVKPNEKVLISNCKLTSLSRNDPCELELFSVDGKKLFIPNKYGLYAENNRKNIRFSQDGSKIIYLGADGGLNILDVVSEADIKVTLEKNTALLNTVKEGIWIDEEGKIKLLGFDGQEKFSFAKTLMSVSGHATERDFYLRLSNIYPSGRLIALASLPDRESDFNTAWATGADQKANKLFDLHYNVTNYESFDNVALFNTQEAFLVATAGNFYKLTTTNERTLLLKDAYNFYS